MKKMVLLLALVLVLGSVIASSAAITPGWYTCVVNQAGSGWGQANPNSGINLTDAAASPAFTNEWFMLETTRVNALLAVALTALANNKNVYCYIPGTMGTISTMYVKQ